MTKKFSDVFVRYWMYCLVGNLLIIIFYRVISGRSLEELVSLNLLKAYGQLALFAFSIAVINSYFLLKVLKSLKLIKKATFIVIILSVLAVMMLQNLFNFSVGSIEVMGQGIVLYVIFAIVNLVIGNLAVLLPHFASGSKRR